MKKYKESSLISFGFKKNSEEYTFKKFIEDLDLIFIAKLDKEEKLLVTVIDSLTNDEFRLHLSPKADGEYVQSVRNEIEKLTESIKNSCAESDLFSMQWQKITEYINNKYNAPIECMWKDKFNSDEGIFRRDDNKKWFAALLICNRKTLTGKGLGKMEVLNVRVDPKKLESFVDNNLFFPGYHMNKKNWISIVLNEGCPLETIFAFIDESYYLNGLSK